MKPLDPTDLRILQYLQRDGKATNKEVSAHLGMSITPVFERIRRMEEQGVIRQYVALVDRTKLGFQLIAFCNVSLKEHSKPMLEVFEKEVNKLAEVVECYHIAGMFDYLMQVLVQDMEAYQHFIVHKLAALDNIGTVQSSFVMTTVKHETAIPTLNN